MYTHVRCMNAKYTFNTLEYLLPLHLLFFQNGQCHLDSSIIDGQHLLHRLRFWLSLDDTVMEILVHVQFLA